MFSELLEREIDVEKEIIGKIAYTIPDEVNGEIDWESSVTSHIYFLEVGRSVNGIPVGAIPSHDENGELEGFLLEEDDNGAKEFCYFSEEEKKKIKKELKKVKSKGIPLQKVYKFRY